MPGNGLPSSGTGNTAPPPGGYPSETWGLGATPGAGQSLAGGTGGGTPPGAGAGLFQTPITPGGQNAWGQGNPTADQQQQMQNALGYAVAQQGADYNAQMGQQGQGYGQQFGALAGQYGTEGTQQYGQLQGAQAQGNAALMSLAAAAAGTTPSAAQIQMQQGTDAAVRAQMAGAASSRGGFGLANAQYNAANNGAALTQQAVDQTAALRAQEMAQAQQAYMQGSLGLGQLANNAAQGFQGQQLGALNAGAQNQLAYEQSGENAQQQAYGLQQGYQQQGLGVQNASAQTGLGWGQIGAGQQAANQEMWGRVIGGGLTAAGAVGGAMIGGPAGAVGGAALGSAAGNAVGGAGGGNAGSSIGSDERVKTEVADAARSEGYKQGAIAGAQEAVKQWTADPGVQAAIQQQHHGNARIPMNNGDMWVPSPQGYVPLSSAPAGTPVQEANEAPRMHAAVEQQKAPPMVPAQPPAPVSNAGILPSDERIKRGAEAEGDSPGSTEPPVDRFLGSLHPKTFAYTSPALEPHPEGRGDRYLGIMAQDLETTPEGAKLVHEGPDGVKRVNVPSLAGATAAAMGRLHERLSKLEGRRGAGVR